MLCKENIGAVGTTRPSGIDFPALLIVLCKNWSTKLDWGTTIADIVDCVLCLGWQDNNFVLRLSTVHTVHECNEAYQTPMTSNIRLISSQVTRKVSLVLLDYVLKVE